MRSSSISRRGRIWRMPCNNRQEPRQKTVARWPSRSASTSRCGSVPAHTLRAAIRTRRDHGARAGHREVGAPRGPSDPPCFLSAAKASTPASQQARPVCRQLRLVEGSVPTATRTAGHADRYRSVGVQVPLRGASLRASNDPARPSRAQEGDTHVVLVAPLSSAGRGHQLQSKYHPSAALDMTAMPLL